MDMKEQINAPPCVKIGVPMNPCAQARYAEQVLGHIDLFGPWAGWKFKGRDLVSPDGLRICPERLRGFLYMEKARKPVIRAAHAAPGVVDLGKYLLDLGPQKAVE